MDGMGQQAAETFDHAIQLAEAARKRQPRDPYVHSDLALYYAKTAQVDLALQRLETAITLSPDSGEVLAAAAEALELVGNRERAIELAHRSLELGFPFQRFQRNPEVAKLLQDAQMQNLP
jgi:tetratricopeptide (TPR) repeat protein